jgi:group I intron endonuclease
MAASGIYKITNKVNGKIYIGSTKNIKRRWKNHLNYLRRNAHPNNYLQNAWNKYGEENFEFEIIEFVEEEKLLEREQYWIDKLNATDKKIGYNIALFAGSPMKGRKHTEETLNKVSKASRYWHIKNKGTEKYNSYLQKLSNSLKGHIVSNETRQKISKANKGKLVGERNPFFGKRHDKDTIIKLSLNRSKLTVKQIKEVKILLNEGEKVTYLAELFNTHHGNIIDIREGKKYDWIDVEDDFEVSKETRCKLLNIKRLKEIKNKGFENEEQIKKIKKLIHIEKQKIAYIAKIFNTYDDKIRDIKKGKIFKWVTDFEKADVKNELLKIDILKCKNYLKKGKLNLNDLIKIFELHNKGMPNNEISPIFNVSPCTIGNILKNKSIKNVLDHLCLINVDNTYNEEMLLDYLFNKDYDYNKYIEMSKNYNNNEVLNCEKC